MAELIILKDVNKIPHPNILRFVGGCSIQGTWKMKMQISTLFLVLHGEQQGHRENSQGPGQNYIWGPYYFIIFKKD